jgi:5-formyltetrahydrofolate cyclo-ligase
MSRVQAPSDGQQETKQVVRHAMRELRRVLPDQPARSVALWLTVTGLPEVRAAENVLAFESVPGEPDSGPFVAWCHEMGKRVTVPASDRAADVPADPAAFDLVVVPGVAFTERGDRLGRGGGWYDRLIPALRPGCATVGVAFDIQVLPELPAEPHDARVSVVVTETRTLRRG